MGNSGCICGKENTNDKVSDVEVPSKEKSKSTMNLPNTVRQCYRHRSLFSISPKQKSSHLLSLGKS